MTDNNQQADAVLDDGCEFVGFVTDAAVMGHGHSAALANFLQPGCIGAIGWEVIRMPFYVQAGSGQDFRKAFSEVAVGEKNVAHETRS